MAQWIAAKERSGFVLVHLVDEFRGRRLYTGRTDWGNVEDGSVTVRAPMKKVKLTAASNLPS